MPDPDGYPTDEELKRIEEWDCIHGSFPELLEYVESLWHIPEWGFKLKGKRVLRLQLHTGGWSGNESIIGALQGNIIFWAKCWVKATRGGHYWFRINLRGW